MAEKQGAGSIWNVNSWHWQMKNYTEISKKILQDKFLNLDIEFNGNKLTHTKVKFPRAEAEVNIRKGKQILMYEFQLELDTHIENDEQQSKGSYKVKEVLNDDLNDLLIEEIKITQKNKVGDEMKKWLKKNIKDKVVNAFREYEGDLSKYEGDPKKLEEDKKKREEAIVATKKAKEEKGEEKEKLLEEQRSKERKLKQEAYQKHFQNKS